MAQEQGRWSRRLRLPAAAWAASSSSGSSSSNRAAQLPGVGVRAEGSISVGSLPLRVRNVALQLSKHASLRGEDSGFLDLDFASGFFV